MSLAPETGGDGMGRKKLYNISQDASQSYNEMADVVVQSGDISQTSDKNSPNVDSGPNTSEEDRKKDAVAAEGGTRQRMISETSLSEDDMAELQQTCHDAFAKIGVYLNGELTGKQSSLDVGYK